MNILLDSWGPNYSMSTEKFQSCFATSEVLGTERKNRGSTTPAAKIRTRSKSVASWLRFFFLWLLFLSMWMAATPGGRRPERSFVMLNENHSDVPNDPTEAGH